MCSAGAEFCASAKFQIGGATMTKKESKGAVLDKENSCVSIDSK